MKRILHLTINLLRNRVDLVNIKLWYFCSWHFVLVQLVGLYTHNSIFYSSQSSHVKESLMAVRNIRNSVSLITSVKTMHIRLLVKEWLIGVLLRDTTRPSLTWWLNMIWFVLVKLLLVHLEWATLQGMLLAHWFCQLAPRGTLQRCSEDGLRRALWVLSDPP